jgi:hypothetical protein
MPLVLTIDKEGMITELIMGGEHLKGTLWDRAFMGIIAKQQPIMDADGKRPVRAGAYLIYTIWSAALKLKLQREWMEPAHIPRYWLEPAHFHLPVPRLEDQIRDLLRQGAAKNRYPVLSDVREPAHWFDPSVILDVEDILTISVMDQVYPELKLGERVAFVRQEALNQLAAQQSATAPSA